MPSTKPAGNGGLTRFALGPWDRSDQACRNAGASYQYHRNRPECPTASPLGSLVASLLGTRSLRSLGVKNRQRTLSTLSRPTNNPRVGRRRNGRVPLLTDWMHRDEQSEDR
jgi:hypothetical protein